MTATAPAGNGGPPALEGGDFYAPLFLTMTPDGRIAFDFAGHISAQGIDVEAHDVFGTDPLPHSAIRWLDVDGVAVGRIHAVTVIDTGILLLDALGVDDHRARIGLLAQPGTHSASVQLDDGTNPQIDRVLIDDLERSSFAQLAEGSDIWRERRVTIAHDLASIAAGASVNVVLPAPAGTVAVGDPIDFLGVNSRAASWGLLSITPESPASVADEISLNIANTHSSALNFGATDFDFHVVNRT